jgi:hypothetical protein
MKRLTVLLAFLPLFCPPPASAWDKTGHMIVAQIAYDRLRDNPNALSRLDTLASIVRFRQHTYNPVTLAAWMDDIKVDDNFPDRATSHAWRVSHYINIELDRPFSLAGVPPPNVLHAINDNIADLKNPALDDNAKAVALAQLLHFVGDVHQPLHCADRHDAGGGDVRVRAVPGVDNLHAFWDEAYRYDTQGGRGRRLFEEAGFSERPRRPGEGWIKQQADEMVRLFPPASARAWHDPNLRDTRPSERDPRKWAERSFSVAKHFAYLPPARGSIPLDGEYVHKAHQIACQRMVLAGMRLARILNVVFPPPG